MSSDHRSKHNTRTVAWLYARAVIAYRSRARSLLFAIETYRLLVSCNDTVDPATVVHSSFDFVGIASVPLSALPDPPNVYHNGQTSHRSQDLNTLLLLDFIEPCMNSGGERYAGQSDQFMWQISLNAARQSRMSDTYAVALRSLVA